MKNNTKNLVIGAFLAGIAAVFQIIPFVLSEALVILTMLSALPIYMSARINIRTGLLSYFVAAILIMSITTHEGILFLFTNGVVGLSLGSCMKYINRKIPTIIISSVFLTVALSIVNYLIGIPVFGLNLPGIFVFQISLIIIFSGIYNTLYLLGANYIYRKITKHYII